MKAYKLTEIAEMEGKHYQTILKTKDQYVRIEIVRGKKKPLVRYFDKETSEYLKKFLESNKK